MTSLTLKIGHTVTEAEIEVQIVAEHVEILLTDWEIEVVALGVDVFEAVRRFAFTGEGTARNSVHQEKSDGEHHPEGDEHPKEAACKKPDHPRPPAEMNFCFSVSSIQMASSGWTSSRFGYQPLT